VQRLVGHEHGNTDLHRASSLVFAEA
jgi:hypothetical protein